MERVRVAIVTPVYFKEARRLRERILAQVAFFTNHPGAYDWQVIIANNGPRKECVAVARALAKEDRRVGWTDVDLAGRGWSLAKTWVEADADVVLYMDADLATNLTAVQTMIQLLVEKRADVVIGSRYVAGAKSRRTWSRWLLSRGYNVLLQIFLGLHVRDSQCGFKGLTKAAAMRIIPLVKDRGFFFDSELLYVAQRLGMRTAEIPVEWEEQDETSVQIFRVSWDYIKNIWRLLWHPPPLHVSRL